MKISLAEREAQLMDVLWDRGPSTVNEVQAALADERAQDGGRYRSRGKEARLGTRRHPGD